jgi:uncharacterized protein (DUF305 family)
MTRTVRGSVLLALLAVLAGGCARTGSAPVAGSAAGGTGPVTSTPAAGPTSPTATFSPTDIAWTQLMIPLNEQTLLLIELTPKQTSDPETRRLATQVGDGHRGELTRLRELLRQAGVPESNEHEGHDMPGMVTTEDLRALTAATGTAFDQLFLTNMRDHLEQTVRLARAEQGSGHEPHVRDLAKEIEQTHTVQLDLLARLGPQGG